MTNIFFNYYKRQRTYLPSNDFSAYNCEIIAVLKFGMYVPLCMHLAKRLEKNYFIVQTLVFWFYCK